MAIGFRRDLACCFLLVLALVSITQVNGNSLNAESEFFERIRSPGTYNRHIRPSGVNGTGSPTIVTVELMFKNFPNIDDKRMEYTAEIFLRARWNDERLKYESDDVKQITLNEPNMIWVPNLYFVNERRSQQSVTPRTVTLIFSDGRITHSISASFTLSCPMNLRYFPLDRQICSLRIASSGRSTDEVVLQWKETEPAQLVRGMSIINFDLLEHTFKSTSIKTVQGEFQTLQVDLTFKRSFGYYLMQLYIPCTMLLIISWLSFWLDISSVATARMLLCLSALLVMATQISTFNRTLPIVPYTKAIDVWTGISLTFVFSALVELVIAYRLSRSEQGSGPKDADLAVAQSAAPSQAPSATGNRGNSYLRSVLSKFPSSSEKMDSVSRIAFPLLFLLFNIIYWSTYLSK